jgi:hypothetical protein
MRFMTGAAFVLCAFLALAAATKPPGQETKAEQANLSGTWEKQGGDVHTHFYIRLVLRSDGTYRKTLNAVVDGIRYGGTHEGRWTAKGTVVYLSGDAKWPAYSHDLSEFEKQRNPHEGEKRRP